MAEREKGKEERSALVFFEKTLQNTSGFFKEKFTKFRGGWKGENTPRGYPEMKVPIYYITKKKGLSRGIRENIFYFSPRGMGRR